MNSASRLVILLMLSSLEYRLSRRTFAFYTAKPDRSAAIQAGREQQKFMVMIHFLRAAFGIPTAAFCLVIRTAAQEAPFVPAV